jgi:hypothetical protein
MSQTSDVVGVIAGMLRGEGGLQTNIDAIVAEQELQAITIGSNQVIAQNIPADLAERNSLAQYPCVHVYCEKVANLLREKFRMLSGSSDIAIEVRASTDRVEDLDLQLNTVVDAITSTLDQNRGDWGAGIFYGGGYEISFGAVKQGGKNFIQTAKVTLTLEISRN